MGILGRAVLHSFAVALLACTVPAQQTPKALSSQPAAPKPDSGSITNNVYRNSTFGFAYKLTYGWVDRTREMTDDPGDSPADSNANQKSVLLLGAFEHPPEVSGDTVNSAVVIAAEPTSSYPGLQNAEQYFGPLTELVQSKGFQVVNEPYDYAIGSTHLVRSDFSKPRGNLTMLQSTLVMIEKGYVVSFTFIAGSEAEMDELMEGLSFAAKQPPAAHK